MKSVKKNINAGDIKRIVQYMKDQKIEPCRRKKDGKEFYVIYVGAEFAKSEDFKKLLSAGLIKRVPRDVMEEWKKNGGYVAKRNERVFMV